MKKKQIVAGIVMGSCLLFLLAGCSDTLSRSFYTHHPRDLQSVEQVWGQPVNVVTLDNGIEKRTYSVQTPYTDLKYRYFLFKNGRVLASGITDTGPVAAQEKATESVAFTPSDLSKAFYERHPTTVAHLDQTWGAPACVEDAEDGNQYRVYAIDTPYADFRYRKFVVRDDRVVASYLAPEESCGMETEPVFHDIEINELSHRYYAAHPMTLEAVETVWGRPVFVRKSEKGLEKRIYRLQVPSDAAFAYRFFIVENGMVVSSGVTDTVNTTVE
jgi:hypothetical protein